MIGVPVAVHLLAFYVCVAVGIAVKAAAELRSDGEEIDAVVALVLAVLIVIWPVMLVEYLVTRGREVRK